MDGGDRPRTGTLLCAGVGRLALGLGEDAALRDEDDELVGELLLELTSKTVMWVSWMRTRGPKKTDRPAPAIETSERREVGLKSPSVNLRSESLPTLHIPPPQPS